MCITVYDRCGYRKRKTLRDGRITNSVLLFNYIYYSCTGVLFSTPGHSRQATCRFAFIGHSATFLWPQLLAHAARVARVEEASVDCRIAIASAVEKGAVPVVRPRGRLVWARGLRGVRMKRARAAPGVELARARGESERPRGGG